MKTLPQRTIVAKLSIEKAAKICKLIILSELRSNAKIMEVIRRDGIIKELLQHLTDEEFDAVLGEIKEAINEKSEGSYN